MAQIPPGCTSGPCNKCFKVHIPDPFRPGGEVDQLIRNATEKIQALSTQEVSSCKIEEIQEVPDENQIKKDILTNAKVAMEKKSQRSNHKGHKPAFYSRSNDVGQYRPSDSQ